MVDLKVEQRVRLVETLVDKMAMKSVELTASSLESRTAETWVRWVEKTVGRSVEWKVEKLVELEQRSESRTAETWVWWVEKTVGRLVEWKVEKSVKMEL